MRDEEHLEQEVSVDGGSDGGDKTARAIHVRD
jgi:hypothetical protein